MRMVWIFLSNKCQIIPHNHVFMGQNHAVTIWLVTYAFFMTCTSFSQQLLNLFKFHFFLTQPSLFSHNNSMKQDQTKDEATLLMCGWMWAWKAWPHLFIYLFSSNHFIHPSKITPIFSTFFFFSHLNSHQRLLAPAQDHQLWRGKGPGPHQREDAAAARCLALGR